MGDVNARKHKGVKEALSSWDEKEFYPTRMRDGVLSQHVLL